MNNPNLRVRTAYTFFDSLLKVDDLINFAINNKYTNVCIADKNNLYGAMELYVKALKNNLKPIIGLEVDYQNHQFLLVALNFNGYKNLMQLSSMIMLEKDLDLTLIDKNIKQLKLDQPIFNFSEKKDQKTLIMFQSISDVVTAKNISPLLTREEYENKMSLKDLKELDELLDRVNLKIPLKKNILPNYLVDGKAVNANKFLKSLLRTSIEKHANLHPTLDIDIYIERMKQEFRVISKMNFEAYFLIVWDIVEFAKQKNIAVGPGRGSAPGSLVAFLLGITAIDPIKNNLLFERFLNSERVTMPDIDIDIEDIRRSEVIDYFVAKYGIEYVAQIITFQTLRSKSSIKDIARINKVNVSEAEKITKLIPDFMDLETSYQKNKKFRFFLESNANYKEIFESAKLIEGLPRQFSTHAAGIVLSDEPIYRSVPVQKGFGNLNQTQYTMDYLEMNGLLKIDILGLRNLSFINETIALIKKQKKVDFKFIIDNFNNKEAFKLLALGNTAGIFQLESPGMTKVLRDMKVSNFEDIVATTSLFRPGPQKMIPTYISRKLGREKITYLDPILKPILESTYGIIVYQEQIMQIVQVYAGFSLAKADILRRAIGKKDITLIEKLEEEFYLGAKILKRSFPQAQEVYDLIYRFADYGFNRSHAFAYSVISYNLALLKAKFPAEFMTSLLSSVVGNISKTSQYIEEAKDLGLEIAIPSLNNVSTVYQTNNKTIYISLRAIKGIGEAAAKELIDEQKNGEYRDLFDFFIRINDRKVSNSTIESLIKAGFLDEFKINRSELIAQLSKIKNYIDLIKVKKDKVISYDREIAPAPKLVFTKKANNLENELAVFGFSLSKDALKSAKKSIKQLIDLDSINEIDDQQDLNVRIVGFLSSIRLHKTKTNQEMAFATIQDDTGRISLTFWPGVYDKYSIELRPGSMIFIEGKVDLKRNKTIIVKEAKEINNAK